MVLNGPAARREDRGDREQATGSQRQGAGTHAITVQNAAAVRDRQTGGVSA